MICPHPHPLRLYFFLLGSSGAGKTTLLDVLAQRKTGGYISGTVKVCFTLHILKTKSKQASKERKKKPRTSYCFILNRLHTHTHTHTHTHIHMRTHTHTNRSTVFSRTTSSSASQDMLSRLTFTLLGQPCARWGLERRRKRKQEERERERERERTYYFLSLRKKSKHIQPSPTISRPWIFRQLSAWRISLLGWYFDVKG